MSSGCAFRSSETRLDQRAKWRLIWDNRRMKSHWNGEPVAVFDAHDDDWCNLAAEERTKVWTWMVEEGLDPGEVFRLEVFLIDCPFARVHEYDRDDEGCLRVEDASPRRIAVRPPRDVLLSSLPPATGREAA